MDDSVQYGLKGAIDDSRFQEDDYCQSEEQELEEAEERRKERKKDKKPSKAEISAKTASETRTYDNGIEKGSKHS